LEYHPDLMRKCHLCDKRFLDDVGQEIHMERDHADNFKCELCDKVLSTRQAWKQHQMTHRADSQKPFVCKQCHKGFGYNFQLKTHMSNIHGVGPPKEKRDEDKSPKMCELCGMSYRCKSSLRLHMFEKHGDDKVRCGQCEMTFNHPVTLQKHVRKKHTATLCPECGEEVAAGKLRQHMLSRHTPDSQKPYQCKWCNKGFSAKLPMIEHTYIHTGERPYNCSFCSRTFNNLSNRTKHLKQSHNEEYRKNPVVSRKDYKAPIGATSEIYHCKN